MTPKIPVHLEADLKNLIKKIIPIPPQIVRSQALRHLSSALAGAATTSLAFAKPFVASDAAVGFSYFFPKEKGLGPAAMSGKRH